MNFSQISEILEFQAKFWILTKFQNFKQVLTELLNFNQISIYQNVNQISKFQPNSQISTTFWLINDKLQNNLESSFTFSKLPQLDISKCKHLKGRPTNRFEGAFLSESGVAAEIFCFQREWRPYLCPCAKTLLIDQHRAKKYAMENFTLWD